ncbi:MAG: type I-C CRISPR-associated endonuclease Cas1 [Opitutales bacterium]|nr:type I-C CRISPR-associated endonuclease Cas1 [Opitutales bacterium]
MRRHLNTLFVTLEGAYLRKDGAAVEVRHEGATKLRVPLHNLDGIVCFGWDCTASAALMGACAEADVALSFHSPHGKFLAAARGFTSGNILLRRAQYRAADHADATLAIARNIVCAKIANARHVLLRAARDHGEKAPFAGEKLLAAGDQLAHRARFAQNAADLDNLRGVEGDSATFYFAAFPGMLVNTALTFSGRSRRPPADPVNALLSFLYVLLVHDCRSALESCGLDPQCGFLHTDRPGRASLALDLMEEFRALLADRAALTLLNRRQITERHFDTRENGGVYLRDDARKTVLTHWQERKQTEILHPLLEEKITLGLLPHIQARLLARHLRGDLDAYPAYIAR